MDRPDGSDAAGEDLVASGAPDAGRDATDGPAGLQLGRARRFLALSGLLAGLAAFALGEAAYRRIPAQKVTFNTMGTMVTAPTPATAAVAEVRNASLAFGLLGLCLGGFLGMAGGAARGSIWAAVAAGALGAIVGAALTAGVSYAVLPYLMKARLDHVDAEMIVSMIAHGGAWGVAGAAAGFAFAFGRGEGRRPVRAVVGGLLGAVLGAIAFDLIGALLFPLAETGDPVSTTWVTRLMARLMVGMATAAGVIVALPRSRPADRDRISTRG